MVAQVDSLKKELDLQDKVLDVRIIKEALIKREYDEFQMAMQHKSKLYIYQELKHEIQFEEYLEYVKGVASRLF